MARLAWAALFTVVAGGAAAGNQQYEPLGDAVRTALAAAVRNDEPRQARFDSLLERIDWLAGMAAHLPRRWQPEHRQRIDFLDAVRYEAQRAGLDPHLVLGLIEVESAFRRYAISHAGARGYMQVMPFWTGVIGDSDPAKLFDMHANLRYGCTILRHYLDIERGNLFRALGRYNGSLGRAEYPNTVLRAWRRWEARAPVRRPAQATLVAGGPGGDAPPQAHLPVGASSAVSPLASAPVPAAGR